MEPREGNSRDEADIGAQCLDATDYDFQSSTSSTVVQAVNFIDANETDGVKEFGLLSPRARHC